MGTTRPRLRFPSPALILSCLALFAALGGSTYAATSISSSTIHFTKAALHNGWTHFGGAKYAPAGYAKDSSGVVHLRGAIHGLDGAVAFVLPKALRPSHLIFPVALGSGPTAVDLRIQPNGAVIPSGPGAGSFTGLDGVSFAAGE